MSTAPECIVCKDLSEQFFLARQTLSDVIMSRARIPPQSEDRSEAMIGFLSELRDLIANAFNVHRREMHASGYGGRAGA